VSSGLWSGVFHGTGVGASAVPACGSSMRLENKNLPRCMHTYVKAPVRCFVCICSCQEHTRLNRVPCAENDMGAVCVGEHRIVSVFRLFFWHSSSASPAAVKAAVVDMQMCLRKRSVSGCRVVPLLSNGSLRIVCCFVINMRHIQQAVYYATVACRLCYSAVCAMVNA
jgi:hypothetical protein